MLLSLLVMSIPLAILVGATIAGAGSRRNASPMHRIAGTTAVLYAGMARVESFFHAYAVRA